MLVKWRKCEIFESRNNYPFFPTKRQNSVIRYSEQKGTCNLKGLSQPLLCFCLHLGTWLTKLLEISTKKYLITKRNSQADFRMVSEPRKQSMAWMETDYSKHTHFRWKIKWRLEHLGAPGIMGEMAHIKKVFVSQFVSPSAQQEVTFSEWSSYLKHQQGKVPYVSAGTTQAQSTHHTQLVLQVLCTGTTSRPEHVKHTWE